MTPSSCARFSHEPLYGRRTPTLFRIAAAVAIAAVLFLAPAQAAAAGPAPRRRWTRYAPWP